MLTTCDKQDGQTFMGEVHRPIGFQRMLCTSESHESMQGPRRVAVTGAEAGAVCWWCMGGESASRATGHAALDTRLHSPHAACLLPPMHYAAIQKKLSKMYQASHRPMTITITFKVDT